VGTGKPFKTVEGRIVGTGGAEKTSRQANPADTQSGKAEKGHWPATWKRLVRWGKRVRRKSSPGKPSPYKLFQKKT